MAIPTSLIDMRERARELANMETNSGASAFVSDAEVNRHINSALAQLYNLLVGARGQEYYASQQPYSLVAGTLQYDLPADFFQLIGVALYDGGSYYQPAVWDWKQIAALAQLGTNGGASAANVVYRVTGRFKPDPTAYSDRIELLPSVTTGWVLSVWYLPAAPVLAADPDTFDGVSGFEEWATLSAAIKMMAKEESDPSVLLNERAILEAQIRQLAPARNADRPASIADTRGDWAGGWPAGSMGWSA